MPIPEQMLAIINPLPRVSLNQLKMYCLRVKRPNLRVLEQILGGLRHLPLTSVSCSTKWY